MDTQVIQEWTDAHVALKGRGDRAVRYQVFQNGSRLFQEIRDANNGLIHMLELPQGIALNRNSYEVLLRYVLTDVVAA